MSASDIPHVDHELRPVVSEAGQQWVERSLRSVWHPCTQMQHHETMPMLPIARGQGAWLFDPDGNRYLDGISSWWVNLFGHANPRINAALKDQLDTLEHAMLSGFTHAPVVELSERLAASTDHALGHCFYASDGASAIEIALKMSFHYWRNMGRPTKQGFVCLQGSYHGETLGALSVTDVALFRDAYGPLLRSAHVLPSPDARQAEPGETAEQVARRALQAVEDLFREQSGNLAAIIIEPLVQCATGMAMYEPMYLTGLRRLCDQYQVHLIADEVAVGCGRTGTFYACEQGGIWPDFLCLSKGISGGYLPLSLVMTRDSIYQAFYSDDMARAFLHSHSYTGNPLVCRAALATLDIFEQDGVLAANRILATHVDAALAPLADHERVKHFRRRGMIWAFDVALTAGDRGFSRRFFEHALRHGLLLRPIGNSVYVMPPYVLDEEAIALLAQQLPKVLEASLED